MWSQRDKFPCGKWSFSRRNIYWCTGGDVTVSSLFAFLPFQVKKKTRAQKHIYSRDLRALHQILRAQLPLSINSSYSPFPLLEQWGRKLNAFYKQQLPSHLLQLAASAQKGSSCMEREREKQNETWERSRWGARKQLLPETESLESAEYLYLTGRFMFPSLLQSKGNVLLCNTTTFILQL